MENFCEKGKIESRTLGALAPVLREKTSEEGRVIYDVCRGEKEKDNLRYDLTKIFAGKIGRELPKTFGHYHGGGMAELFEVIEGKTLAIMQKQGAEPNIIEEVYLVESGEGEKFIIPPEFGFDNTNPSQAADLIFSNWISKSVENQYEHVKNLHGLCYYIIQDEKDNMVFEKNENYERVPELIKIKPKELPEELENLDFLNHPEKYKDILTIKNLYTIS